MDGCIQGIKIKVGDGVRLRSSGDGWAVVACLCADEIFASKWVMTFKVCVCVWR